MMGDITSKLSWSDLFEPERALIELLTKRILGRQSKAPGAVVAVPASPWARLEHEGHQILLIDGPRGCGKTSLLMAAIAAWQGQLGLGNGRWADAGGAERLALLSQSGAFIRVLPPLDNDPQPTHHHPYAWIVQALEPIVTYVEPVLDRASDDSWSLEPKDLRGHWSALYRKALIGWDSALAHIQMEDIEEFVHDHAEAGRGWQDLRHRFREFVDELLRALGRRESFPPGGLLVVPIDDIDLRPGGAKDLLLALRLCWHPRLVFVLTGDSEHLRATLEGELERSFDEAFGRRFLKRLPTRGSTDAGHLAAALLEKSVPEWCRLRMPRPDVEMALMFLKRGVDDGPFPGALLPETVTRLSPKAPTFLFRALEAAVQMAAEEGESLVSRLVDAQAGAARRRLPGWAAGRRVTLTGERLVARNDADWSARVGRALLTLDDPWASGTVEPLGWLDALDALVRGGAEGTIGAEFLRVRPSQDPERWTPIRITIVEPSRLAAVAGAWPQDCASGEAMAAAVLELAMIASGGEPRGRDTTPEEYLGRVAEDPRARGLLSDLTAVVDPQPYWWVDGLRRQFQRAKVGEWFGAAEAPANPLLEEARPGGDRLETLFARFTLVPPWPWQSRVSLRRLFASTRTGTPWDLPLLLSDQLGADGRARVLKKLVGQQRAVGRSATVLLHVLWQACVEADATGSGLDAEAIQLTDDAAALRYSGAPIEFKASGYQEHLVAGSRIRLAEGWCASLTGGKNVSGPCVTYLAILQPLLSAWEMEGASRLRVAPLVVVASKASTLPNLPKTRSFLLERSRVVRWQRLCAFYVAELAATHVPLLALNRWLESEWLATAAEPDTSDEGGPWLGGFEPPTFPIPENLLSGNQATWMNLDLEGIDGSAIKEGFPDLAEFVRRAQALEITADEAGTQRFVARRLVRLYWNADQSELERCGIPSEEAAEFVSARGTLAARNLALPWQILRTSTPERWLAAARQLQAGSPG